MKNAESQLFNEKKTKRPKSEKDQNVNHDFSAVTGFQKLGETWFDKKFPNFRLVTNLRLRKKSGERIGPPWHSLDVVLFAVLLVLDEEVSEIFWILKKKKQNFWQIGYLTRFQVSIAKTKFWNPNVSEIGEIDLKNVLCRHFRIG